MRGWDSVTVPGAVAAWVDAARERFGKLPFADLFEPAIEYGREGFLRVADHRAASGRAQVAELQEPARLRRGLPAGRPRAQAGERFTFPAARRGAASRSPRPRARPSTAASSPSASQRIAQAARRRDDAQPTSPRTSPTGSTPIAHGLPRLHAARDPAERPGHRRADGARHPARTSTCARIPVDGADSAAPADRGDEARLRRCLRATWPTSTHMDVTPAAAARRRLPRERARS